jgi:hypothetical protein
MTEEIKVTLRGEPGAEPNDSLGIKGSALTYSELDSNFEKLRDGINQLLVTVDYISLDNNTNKITEGSDNSVEETEPGLGDGTNNLFYTDEKVQTYLTDNDYTNQEWVLTQLTALSGAVTELTTSDGITEGTENLYYTDARARSAISVDGNLTYDSATGVISYTAPTIEWTVVENTPTTVSNYGITDVYTKSETDAAITNRVTEIASGDISLTGYATEAYADQAEVDAKAYTDTRETAITSAYAEAISTAVAGKDNTDEITEGSTNLYFTEGRVQTYLTDNNFATQLYVASTVNSIIYQNTFSDVATSGSYTDLDDIPTDLITLESISVSGDLAYDNTTGVISYTTPTDLITLESISVSGDLAYDNTTGVISYTTPNNISHFENDAAYLVNSDLDNITDRLDVIETPVYTIFDLFKHMYDSTGLDEQYLYFSIRAIDQFRYAWLSSGQSDPTWDALVDSIYDNNIDAVTSVFLGITNAAEQSVFLVPYLSLINSDLTVINEIENTTYDTMTFAELLNIPEWQSRNTGFDTSATSVRNQLNSTDDVFIRAWLKANSYADFRSDTIITGWNPA